MTIAILLDILYMYKDSLPEVLFLQIDNWWRENKNNYVFAFCALLVELGVFRKVKVGFLIVGHTHEDVDQLFSRFSTYLRRNDVLTMESLTSALEKSYTPRPIAIIVENMPNVSTWLGGKIEAIVDHSRPHVFKFTCNRNGKAVLVFKIQINFLKLLGQK